MTILPLENIKLTLKLVYQAEDISMMKLKNIVICGGTEVSFQQKNIFRITI